MNASNFENENKPEDCFKLKIVTIYLVTIFIVGIAFNSSLLWVFYQKKQLRTPFGVLLIALIVNNIIGCIIEIPMRVVSNYICKYKLN
jgi:peptidoglycan biosynthesis protein MviN/MurJ (putative lipid II flippase)